jgi:magnesium and cobalt transporter
MSAVEFSEIDVKEVMVPRTEMIGLDVTSSVTEALGVVVESGHSRIPVYENNLDNIVGLLHAKDLLGQLDSPGSEPPTSLQSIVRKPPMFAPETQKISDLLGKMRSRGKHMAIVVDEFGGTAGLITLEDIIEELVGEIRDEFDFEESPVHRTSKNTWIVDAKISLSDLRDATGIELPDSGDYESVGGFVVAVNGTIPATGKIITHECIQAKVLASDPRRIERLEVTLLDEPVTEEDG